MPFDPVISLLQSILENFPEMPANTFLSIYKDVHPSFIYSSEKLETISSNMEMIHNYIVEKH